MTPACTFAAATHVRPSYLPRCALEKVQGRAGRRGSENPRTFAPRGTKVVRKQNRRFVFSPTSRARCLRLAPRNPRWAISFRLPWLARAWPSARKPNHRSGLDRCARRLALGAQRAPNPLAEPSAGTSRLGPPVWGVHLGTPNDRPPHPPRACDADQSPLGWDGMGAWIKGEYGGNMILFL